MCICLFRVGNVAQEICLSCCLIHFSHWSVIEKAMRSVRYMQRVSLDFTGTIFPHAICLGDADNDSLKELVLGDTSRKLYIYKNDD